MGWSYRKSFGSGPFRINFSKSGISYSGTLSFAAVMDVRSAIRWLREHGKELILIQDGLLRPEIPPAAIWYWLRL